MMSAFTKPNSMGISLGSAIAIVPFSDTIAIVVCQAPSFAFVKLLNMVFPVSFLSDSVSSFIGVSVGAGVSVGTGVVRVTSAEFDAELDDIEPLDIGCLEQASRSIHIKIDNTESANVFCFIIESPFCVIEVLELLYGKEGKGHIAD
jgi:hypothetical protein